MATLPSTPGAVPALPPVMPPMPAPRQSRLDSYQEVDTQPLFFRHKIPGDTVLPALSKIDSFNVRKNQSPHLTNCEEAGSMPNTSGYKIAGIEIVPNANCSVNAFRLLIASTRLMIEVGTKGIEKINQPSVFFGSSAHGSLADNTATLKAGLYTLSKGEEISLEPDQPFRVYLQLDDLGFTVPKGETLDFIIKFWGQKRGRVSLG